MIVRIFLSDFWQELINCKKSCLCNNKAHEWVKWLTWVIYWNNTLWKTSIGITPYEALYGRSPPTILQYVSKIARVQSVEDTLYEREKFKMVQ